MNLYSETQYKDIIRKRVKILARTKTRLTLQKIAQRISIQNTYLSKALNDEKTHLNEDHLYKICQILEFFPAEVDYIFLLRAQDVSADPARKAFLETKINRLRQSSQRSATFAEAETRSLNSEMAYLFDPTCMLVQVALFIDDYRKNPRKLAPVLGISQARLVQVLHKLNDLGFIDWDEDKCVVVAIKHSQLHYGTDHPLMRTHQSLLRQKCGAHVIQTAEDEKHCFMGTFSADMETFHKVKARFQVFLKEAEQLIGPAPSQHVFQMNFDVFKWF